MGLFRIGGEMQIGEQDLALVELLALDGQRLLHLHDHFRFGEDLVGILDDGGARCDVVGVGNPRAKTRACLHHHLVAVVHQFLHGRRDEAHAIFVVLDFFRHTDAHDLLLSLGMMGGLRLAATPGRQYDLGIKQLLAHLA